MFAFYGSIFIQPTQRMGLSSGLNIQWSLKNRKMKYVLRIPILSCIYGYLEKEEFLVMMLAYIFCVSLGFR